MGRASVQGVEVVSTPWDTDRSKSERAMPSNPLTRPDLSVLLGSCSLLCFPPLGLSCSHFPARAGEQRGQGAFLLHPPAPRPALLLTSRLSVAGHYWKGTSCTYPWRPRAGPRGDATQLIPEGSILAPVQRLGSLQPPGDVCEPLPEQDWGHCPSLRLIPVSLVARPISMVCEVRSPLSVPPAWEPGVPGSAQHTRLLCCPPSFPKVATPNSHLVKC